MCEVDRCCQERQVTTQQAHADMWRTLCNRYLVYKRLEITSNSTSSERFLHILLPKRVIGQPHEDPDHRDFVPSKMPACYGKKVPQRQQEQAERRQQRLMKRRTAAEAIWSRKSNVFKKKINKQN